MQDKKECFSCDTGRKQLSALRQGMIIQTGSRRNKNTNILNILLENNNFLLLLLLSQILLLRLFQDRNYCREETCCLDQKLSRIGSNQLNTVWICHLSHQQPNVAFVAVWCVQQREDTVYFCCTSFCCWSLTKDIRLKWLLERLQQW